MTIFVSVDCATGIIKRFDASLPGGLTHVGRIVQGGDEVTVADMIRGFLLMPPDALAVQGETRLLPAPAEVVA